VLVKKEMYDNLLPLASLNEMNDCPRTNGWFEISNLNGSIAIID
jgi:hypothetical protein